MIADPGAGGDAPVKAKRVLHAHPRPSRMGVPAEERARLLNREREGCGPNHLAQRVKALAEARWTGDPRLLAGSLDDVAAAALNWRERVLADAQRPAA